MSIQEQQITEFQKLYKEEYGEDISKEEAYDKGLRLVQLIQAVYKPANATKNE